MDEGENNYSKLRDELIGHGLYEVGMNKEDMLNLLSAIHNSEETAKKEDSIREITVDKTVSTESDNTDLEAKMTPSPFKRTYKNSPERRMPWVLFPQSDKLTSEQKTRILLKYKEQLNIRQYCRARMSTKFADWDCVLTIPLSKQKSSPDSKKAVLHTRSGRTVRTLSHYIDDGSDSESAPAEKRSRKRMKKSLNDDVKSSQFQNDINSSSIDVELYPANNIEKHDLSVDEENAFNSDRKDYPKPSKLPKDSISKDCSAKIPTWDIEV